MYWRLGGGEGEFNVGDLSPESQRPIMDHRLYLEEEGWEMNVWDEIRGGERREERVDVRGGR